jgi:hypothetical protein
VTAAAAHHADYRPALDDVSQGGLIERASTAEARTESGRTDARRTSAPPDPAHAPEAILWAVLSIAPDNGITVPELMDETGMSRPWVYQRLQELVRTGQVTQVTRGRWRAAIGHAR